LLLLDANAGFLKNFSRKQKWKALTFMLAIEFSSKYLSEVLNNTRKMFNLRLLFFVWPLDFLYSVSIESSYP
jgi:hypothetical protein